MVIFMRFYTHSLMRLNLPFYAVYRAIFMLLHALFCAVIASLYFALIIILVWFVALFLRDRYRASHAVLSLVLSGSH